MRKLTTRCTRNTVGNLGSQGLLLAVAALVALTCESNPDDGFEGGDCRFGSMACEQGLVCMHGTCESPDDGTDDGTNNGDGDGDDNEPASVVDLGFSLGETQMIADGQDTLILTVVGFVQATSIPYDGDVVVVVEPPGAAYLTRNLNPMVAGRARVQIRACDAQASVCPSSFRIAVALAERPVNFLAWSPPVSYVGGADGGGATKPGGSSSLFPLMPGVEECTADGEDHILVFNISEGRDGDYAVADRELTHDGGNGALFRADAQVDSGPWMKFRLPGAADRYGPEAGTLTISMDEDQREQAEYGVDINWNSEQAGVPCSAHNFPGEIKMFQFSEGDDTWAFTFALGCDHPVRGAVQFSGCLSSDQK